MKTPHLPFETPIGQFTPLNDRSRRLRHQVVKIFSCSRRGHLGATFSLIEMLSVLYDHILRYDPKHPNWPGRDRCILSKGHGCLALYVVLADKGFFPESDLWGFCKADGILGGHPDYNKIPGVEASTGALGHGLSIGVGMAVNGRYEGSAHRVFVVLGDGECNEGSIWEAALSAGNRHLSNLCILVDYNKHQSYDSTFSVQNLEPLAAKWESFGFATEEVDGHDITSLKTVLSRVPFEPDKPSAIICHTIKGKGISFAENNLDWHHKNKITDEELAAMVGELEVG
jgi:transketolase